MAATKVECAVANTKAFAETMLNDLGGSEYDVWDYLFRMAEWFEGMADGADRSLNDDTQDGEGD